MAEQEPDLHEQYAAMETAAQEPTMVRILNDARAANKLLANEEMDIEDAKELLYELDVEWLKAGYRNNVMIVTGNTTWYQKFLQHENVIFKVEKNINPCFLAEEKWMESDGFILEDNGNCPRFKLLGNCEEYPQMDYSNLPGKHMYFGVDIDLVDIEFPSILTKERAFAILEENHSELLENIEARILNLTGDSADMILALRHLDLTSLQDSDDPIRSKNAIEYYLNTTINPDTAVTHSFAGNGLMQYLSSENDEEYNQAHISCDGLLMNIKGIAVRTFFLRGKEPKDMLTVACKLIGPEYGSECIAFVTVDMLEELVSFRTQYFGD